MDGKPAANKSPPGTVVKKENEEEIKVREFVCKYNILLFFDSDVSFRRMTVVVLRYRLVGNRPVAVRLVTGDRGIVFLNLILGTYKVCSSREGSFIKNLQCSGGLRE